MKAASIELNALQGACKWAFKSFVGQAVAELSDEQRKRIPTYEQALVIAGASKVPSPPFSNYFCKESIGTNPTNFTPAGNIEYGLCQAIHGEESAVANLRASQIQESEYGDIVLGIIAGNPDDVPNPCGNCRDVMLDGIGEEFEIVSGAPEGGLAIVAPFKSFLFKEPKEIREIPEIELENFEELIMLKMEEANALTSDPYSPSKVHPERKYFAILFTKKNLYVGTRDIMVDYHPLYPLRDAIRQATRANDHTIMGIAIVREDEGQDIPHVMYKDRQHLLEFNLQNELIHDDEQDPPIVLVTHDGKGNITRLCRTSVKEWLPFPFTPRNFGAEFLEYLRAYHKNKIVDFPKH